LNNSMRLKNFFAAAALALLLSVSSLAQTATDSSLPRTSGPHPKILIIYDMEGVSMLTNVDYLRFDRTATYAQGRKWLTSDVNAAIRGLAKGGAGPIWVQDAHGSGNSKEPDVLLNEMDPRATFDFRSNDFDPYSTGIDGSVDAIICIAMHARANSPGFAAHTYTIDVDFRVNEVEFTETHIIALSAARWGIPVIMVSGDNILGEQLKPDFPELEYATVKTAKGHADAQTLAPGEAEKRIEASAKLAMEKFLTGKFRPYYLRPPYDFRLSFPDYEETNGAAMNPLVERDGDLAVRFRRQSYIEGYEIAKTSIHLAVQESVMGMLTRLLSKDPAGQKSLQQLEDMVFERWLDREHAPDWSKPGPKPAPKERFYGDN